MTAVEPAFVAPGEAAPAGEARPSWPALVPRHPIVGAALGLVSVLVLGALGFTLEGLIGLVGAWALVLLASIDVVHRLLPNPLVLGTWSLVLLGRLADAPNDALEGLFAGLAAAAFLGAPLLVRRDAVGFGDVKLALLLGALVGWGVFVAIVLASFALLPVAVWLLVRDGTVKGATLPFGPFLAFGTLVVLCVA